MKWVILILCCLVVLWIVACTSTADRIRNDQTQASDILLALENYQRDHGRFPNELDDLAPTYLEEVPKTTGRQDFAYTLDVADGYHLCFAYPSRSTCCYIQRLAAWDCSPGSPETK